MIKVSVKPFHHARRRIPIRVPDWEKFADCSGFAKQNGGVSRRAACAEGTLGGALKQVWAAAQHSLPLNE